MRAVLWSLAAATALLLGLAALPAEPFARRLLARASPAGGTLAADSIGGTFLTAVELRGLRWRGPAGEAYADRVRIEVALSGLARRRVVVQRLEIDRLDAALDPDGLRRPVSPGRPSAWTVEVLAFELRDAALALGRRRVDDLDARGSWTGGRLAVDAHFEGALRGRLLGSLGGGRWRLETRASTTEGRPLSLAMTAAGAGLSPSSMTARVELSAHERAGRVLAATAAVSSGTARFQAALARPWSGSASGVLDFASRRVDARWRLATPAGAAEGSARGTAASHEMRWAVRSTAAAVSLAGRGSWNGGVWSALWRQARVDRPLALTSEGPFRTRWSRTSAAIEGLTLKGGATRLSVSGERAGAVWRRLSAAIDADLREWAQAGVWRSPLTGRLSASAQLSGDLRAPSGVVRARLDGAAVADIDAGRAELEAVLDGRRARLDRLEWALGGGRAWLTGTIPLRFGAPDGADFSARLRAERFDAAAAARRLGAVRIAEPRVDADLTVAREDGVWKLAGGGRLAAAAVEIPAAGVRLGRGEADWEADGDRLVVRRSALSPQGKGARCELSGHVSASGPELRVTGERLRFDTGRGLTGESDAVVDIAGSWRAPIITGTAAVRHGELALRGRRPREPSRAPAKPSAASLDLRLVFDRDVWYRERGSALEFKGDLRLRKKPFEPARLVGSIETVRGEYGHVGRVFQVEQGAIRFGGGTVQEAALQARGLYVDEATRIKIRLGLSGTLGQPRLSLSSEPPMEERDIMSFLVYGRPLYEVGAADARRTGGAEEAAKLIGDYLSQGIRAHLPPQLGVDVFRLNVRHRRPDVTVGRYLSRRLFVSYGQTIGEDRQKRLNASYQLSPRWSVETENTNQGRNLVDLLFNWGFR